MVLGNIIAPLLGGFLNDKFDFRWVCGIVAGIELCLFFFYILCICIVGKEKALDKKDFKEANEPSFGGEVRPLNYSLALKDS